MLNAITADKSITGETHESIPASKALIATPAICGCSTISTLSYPTSSNTFVDTALSSSLSVQFILVSFLRNS